MKTTRRTAPNQRPNKLAAERWPWGVVAIPGGFVVLSLLILAASWPRYQIDRHTAAAMNALAEERFEDAIPHLIFVTNRFEGAWRRFKQLGDCYLALDRAEEALQAYEQSLRHEPDQRLEGKLGRAHFLLDHREDAIGHFQSAINSDPHDPETNFYVGLFYMKERDFQRAAPHFQRATADPKLREAAQMQQKEVRRQLLGDGSASAPERSAPVTP